jgi:hypothetical protein
MGKIYQMAIKLPNGHKIYQMFIIYSKWPLNIPIFSISRTSKNYPKWDFWFENIPSGNPARICFCPIKGLALSAAGKTHNSLFQP